MRAEYYYTTGFTPNTFIFGCFDFFFVSFRVWRRGSNYYNQDNIKYF